MDRFMRRWIFPLFALLLLAGCNGYHFTYMPEFGGDPLPPAKVKVIGVGAQEQPRLARLLEEQMQMRMGGNEVRQAKASTTVLEVLLQPLKRTLRLQEKSGRSDQYRITVTARPVWLMHGKIANPTLPKVEARVNYYEMEAATTNQEAQDRAREEVINQLVENLTTILYEPPSQK
uniref:LPS-assembly lipoprotein LptE n=1 Tax=Magnetococcus massalia (strain MO-1) TaxID=451514 RepID=A0A1S7LK21_MAGMO|nr:Conserved protein of unknown function [Candidatus Magnetococcus massalia]